MKIPGTPLETLARTGAPDEIGRWLWRWGLSESVVAITHGNIRDEMSKECS